MTKHVTDFKGLFGTDGIRSRAHEFPLVPWLIEGLGWAFAKVQGPLAIGQRRVVMARDTRASGKSIAAALTRGFTSCGYKVIDAGVLPTPAVSCLVRAWDADLGCVISASHNPPEFNGIKFFGADGGKIPKEWEDKVETLLADFQRSRAAATSLRPAVTMTDEAYCRYRDFLIANFDADIDLKGMRIAVDCAHGSALRVVPDVLRRLGAEVLEYGVSADGRNINTGCGALFPKDLARQVVKMGCDVGFALDGDGDRLVVVDEKGAVLTGEWVMATIALYRAQNLMAGSWGMVTTQISNLALAQRLQKRGIQVFETQVGDRWVLEKLKELKLGFGGENSGHYIWMEHLPSADGALSIIFLAQMIRRLGREASKVFERFKLMPQVGITVATPTNRPPLDHLVGFQKQLSRVRQALKGKGRVLVRYSGTEPILRILLEAEEPIARLRGMGEDLKAAFLRALD